MPYQVLLGCIETTCPRHELRERPLGVLHLGLSLTEKKKKTYEQDTRPGCLPRAHLDEVGVHELSC